jgi:hypothetical protein
MAEMDSFMPHVGFGDKKIPGGGRGELRMEDGKLRIENVAGIE